MLLKSTVLLFAISLALILSGCGGGGGKTTITNTPTAAQTTSTGKISGQKHEKQETLGLIFL
jgi:hypothetical protein